MPVLLIEVHLLEPVWHGEVDWPPSPFRLFQALVAGACGGRWVGEDADARDRRTKALQWLESQNPPSIGCPPRSSGRNVTSFVPNNDLDSVDGDPNRVSEIRAEKTLVPWQIETGGSFLYAWTFEGGDEPASTICGLAERLYRLGRGLDGAWARARVVAYADADALLQLRGAVSRPTGPGHQGLRCPDAGSLESLIRRHDAAASRFKWDKRSRRFLFRQPPKPIYRTISYDSPGVRLYFEIRQSADLDRFQAISQTKVVSLTEEIRDKAARRLVEAMPEVLPLSDRFLIGRMAGRDDLGRRVRIVALPSIGHAQTSPSIRRVAVLIPADCPIPSADLEWAFSGLNFYGCGKNTVAGAPAMLVRCEAPDMVHQYGFDRPAKHWRSITPIALPQSKGYGRSGPQRAKYEDQLVAGVAQACRHAGIAPRPSEIRIQAEPFLLRGEPARTFVTERFSGRLSHAEITFEKPVQGPLVIGDGRFLGLGLMRPVLEKSLGVTSLPWRQPGV